MHRRLAAFALLLVVASVLFFITSEWAIRSMLSRMRSDRSAGLENLELSWLDGPQFVPESVQPPAGYASTYSYINDEYPTEVNRIRVLQRLGRAASIPLIVGLIVLAGVGIEASFKL